MISFSERVISFYQRIFLYLGKYSSFPVNIHSFQGNYWSIMPRKAPRILGFAGDIYTQYRPLSPAKHW